METRLWLKRDWIVYRNEVQMLSSDYDHEAGVTQ